MVKKELNPSRFFYNILKIYNMNINQSWCYQMYTNYNIHDTVKCEHLLNVNFIFKNKNNIAFNAYYATLYIILI